MEPEKPFACTIPDCGMTFTNEDHLHVHTKKHDMVLQLGLEQKAAFVADQTPTPTRFIRNCEEVGLFQDLQNVNPFDEGFKRAMETKHGVLSLEGANGSSSDDVLHTPHLVFPNIDSGDCALYSTTNNQRNITISRSSSDESGAVKEYETTTISKLTNEVTTISRVVGKQDLLDRVTTTDDVSIVRHEETARNKDGLNETVSYTNNIIKIHSNVEIRKDDSVIKDATNVVTNDVLLTDSNKLHVPQGKVPPIMSQRSLDFVVDSLTTDACHNEAIDREKEHLLKTLKRNYDNALNKNYNQVEKTDMNIKNNIINKDLKDNDYEVIIKLPNGKQVRMKAIEDDTQNDKTVKEDTREKLKKVLTNKVKDKQETRIPNFQRLSSLQNAHIVQNILPLTTATLIPVTIVSPPNTIMQPTLQNVSLVPIDTVKLKKNDNYKAVKRKSIINNETKQKHTNKSEGNKLTSLDSNKSPRKPNLDDDCIIVDNNNIAQPRRHSPSQQYLENRSAASKRYRKRLRETMKQQSEENRFLREKNKILTAEKAELKLIITEHLRKCPMADDLRDIQERLRKATTGL
ncbi:Cyclic AMP-dependent transcription factor ATF-2 [Papilio xuthus]|uniref:Cyclic AMP-dependent transcription factor ATF-2 n=1 Tax=Papilio xuthus TaxID=66420 RepID=A0A194PUM4_PAPXU|nr:Cyclic AMP-dependent transcription factor ATF-2 [Papilio xuthus]